MFNNPWFLVFSLEIVFLGFICLASGNFKSGYITFLIGIIFLSSSGMSGQGVTIAELLTPENVAALLLLFTLLLIFSLPFAHYLRPSCDSPKDGAQEER
jgi:phosphoglycerol transferase MdoB-like AlkP superfamily enzyme